MAAVAAGCDERRGPILDPDAGAGPLTCASNEDCAGTGVCMGGLCQGVSTCNADEECSGEGKFCHEQRLFCVECDGRPGQCGEGKVCQFDFTCVDVSTGGADAGMSGCSGSCSENSECAPDRICRGGACCNPPTRCASNEDCPASRPQCNGATGQCFGGGPGCLDDADCASEPGCEDGACFCEIRGAPPGQCRVRPDECASDRDCWESGAYAQRYCALSSRPRRCLDTIPCTRDLDCANLGLVCDLQTGSSSEGFCINGIPCPMGTECDPATQVCVDGLCVGANCVNQPSRCGPGETCNPTTGECESMGGVPCSRNEDCPQGQYCNTNVNPNRCENGCRSNADCPGGICNAMNQCEFPNNALCGPCTSDNDCPAGTRCVDFAGTSLCREQCLTSQSCSDPNRSCVLLFCSCLL